MIPRPQTAHTVPVTALLGALGHWAGGHEPLYLQLAQAIREAIRSGALPRGAFLPPQRTLASSLAVSRTTVIGAIEELKREGWLSSAQGSGTWIALPKRDVDETFPESDAMSSYRIRRLARVGSEEAAGGVLDLGTAVFDEPMGLPDVGDLTAEDVRRLVQAGGLAPVGIPELRASLALFLTSQGLPTTPGQICITSGGQQALWLLSSVLAGDGTPVVVEDPTWTGGLDSIRVSGAQLLSVPVRADGLDVAALQAVVERARPGMVCLVPEVHNPTGVRMGDAHRAAVAKLSAEHGVALVEDYALWGLTWRNGAHRIRSFADYHPGARVVTFGTFTKVFWRGFSVGWIRGPEGLVQRLGKLKAATDAGTAMFTQVAAARALLRFDEIRQRRVRHVGEALAAVTGWADALDPPWRYQEPDGGLGLWMRLPLGDAIEFSQMAMRHGVEVWPGPVFSPTGSFADHLRLSLARPLDVVTQALPRLGRAWREYVSRSRRPNVYALGPRHRPHRR